VAQLDRFLQALVERQGKELRLRSGEVPSFVFDSGAKPASSARPNTDQVLGLIGEIVGPARLDELRQQGAISMPIERPGLPAISLAARFAGGIAEASLRLAEAAPEAAPAAPSEAAAPAEATRQAIPVSDADVPKPTGPSVEVDLDDINVLLRALFDSGSSDLHISSDEKPMLRLDGTMKRIDEWPVLDESAVWQLLEPIIPERNRGEYEQTHDTDFAHEIPGVARYRANIFTDRKGPGAVFRVIPSKILTAEQLGISEKILELCKLTKGLVLVTGPTGSGKSTTLTALIDFINKTRDDHIITIEDPIEFVHENIRCLVNQREVSRHTQSFKRALRAALREDPDIVLVGEMRDLETISIAIETAETGHLVFGTLHTTTAVGTIDRIIDQFPQAEQAQVRTMLSESLKGVIAQNLCKKIGGGRVAALEVLIGTPSVANLIREGKTFQIPSMIQTGKRHGMVSLNEALVNLVKDGKVEAEEAYRKSVDKIAMANALKTAGCDTSFLPKDREEALV
jgi:twitching motility protein PilT